MTQARMGVATVLFLFSSVHLMCPVAAKLGIQTSGQALKDMLEKTGYNVKKVQLMEKLDLLELIRDQLQTALEKRMKTGLKLEELISFLRFEGMELESGHARDAILELEKLRIRERERLGKHLAPDEFEAYENALALIPDSEVHEVFDNLLAEMAQSGNAAGEVVKNAAGLAKEVTSAEQADEISEALVKKTPVKALVALRLLSFEASSKVKVIKEVQGLFGEGLKASKELVEQAPCILRTGAPQAEAEEQAEKLRQAGAKVVLERL